MDFCQLLHTAQKNDKNSANGVRYYSTKFEPPKKIKKEHKDLSSNIKKFLAKKEAEEQQKRDDAQKKKEELLALRAQDKKATRRVNVMLKSTKSANKSVIEDAIDNTHTAVTMAGPLQPDEDDYGYVSQEASQYYEKMMERFSKMPEEPKFNMFKKKVGTNLKDTKERVKAALEKEREEAMGPHKRKRKKKHEEGQEGDDTKDDDKNDNSPEHKESISRDIKEKDVPKSKPKPKPAPPPMSFTELLKIAEKKQFEPILIEKKVEEDEKLMTKRQRKEAEREREWRERKEERDRNRMNDSKNPESRSNERDVDRERDGEKSSKGSHIPINSSKASSIKATTSSSSNGEFKILERQLTKPISSNTERSINKDKIPLKQSKPSNSGSNSMKSNGESFKKPFSLDSRPAKPSGVSKSDEFRVPKSKDSLSSSSNRPPSVSNGNVKSSSFNSGSISNKSSSSNSGSMSNKSSEQRAPMVSKSTPPTAKNSAPTSRDVNIKKGDAGLKKSIPPPASSKPKEFPPRDLLPKGKPKEFPPRDLKPKQFPPPDVRGIKRKQPMVNKGRILDDSEEEYDSEMDDFIDDGDEDGDYSKYIKEIFGYDKSRYRAIDDDDDNMETSFAQQMKEEVISTKLGIMEDLEDMKQEEEEKRRKALRMKKMRR